MVKRLLLKVPAQACADTHTLCSSQSKFTPRHIPAANVSHQITHTKNTSPTNTGEPAYAPRRRATTTLGTAAGRPPPCVPAEPESATRALPILSLHAVVLLTTVYFHIYLACVPYKGTTCCSTLRQPSDTIKKRWSCNVTGTRACSTQTVSLQYLSPAQASKYAPNFLSLSSALHTRFFSTAVVVGIRRRDECTRERMR